MTDQPHSLGRILSWRLEARQPLSALSPLWAALCGLLASGGMGWDTHTLLVLVVLVLLVEPLLGGLWDLAFTPPAKSTQPPESSASEPVALSLPYQRPGSAADRLLARLADVPGRGAQPLAFAAVLAFAVAVGAVLNNTLVGVAAAVLVLFLRLLWGRGPLAWVLGGLYHLAIPWLMGMLALGELVERGPELYWPRCWQRLSMLSPTLLPWRWPTACACRRCWSWTWPRRRWWGCCLPARRPWPCGCLGCAWWRRRSSIPASLPAARAPATCVAAGCTC